MKNTRKLHFLAMGLLCLSQTALAQNDGSIFCGNNLPHWPHVLYVSLTDINQIQERDLTTGQVLATITTGLNGPNGLTISGSNLYVANSLGNNVAVYNTSLRHVKTLTGGLSSPQGVAVDAYGDVYITNSLANNIVALRMDGTIAEVVTSDTNGNPFQSPDPVAIFNKNIYAGPVFVPPGVAVESFNVGEFLTGEPSVAATFTQGIDSPSGIAFDAAGNVYVSQYSSGVANKYSPTGQLLQTFRDPTGGGGFCRGVAVDFTTGNVYVSNGSPINSISVFGPGGNLITTFH